MILIRQYKPKDQKALVGLIEELQDYLVKIDPLQRLRRLPEYGEKYIKNLLKKVKANHGAIFIASLEDNLLGFIAGTVEKQNKDDLLEYVPTKEGRILELIVSEKQRGQNTGSLLMKKMEEYFKRQNCDVVRVEVFEPNDGAHNFYKKLGYGDRVVDLIKKIHDKHQ